MNETIIHRGPDDSGLYVDGAVALGHRRLSIVDLARGHQPMQTHLGSEQIIFNGEIYNHMAVRNSLQTANDSFRTTCDTETLLVSYQEQGADCLGLLRGMFAFAIYDPEQRSLFLARDRMGIKPLYIYQSGGLLAFASEIKALLAHPEIRAEVNVERLPVQLTLKYTLDDQTMFRNITKLPPGHFLRLDSREVTQKQYWDMSFTPKRTFSSIEEAGEEFKTLFDDSVKERLMADVPLGVFLSGGIDSSVIAASMATMVDEPIKSFSVAFAERDYSELEYSRVVAQSIGADLHEITVSPDQWFAAWPKMVYHEDEPIAHPSSIPLHFVSKLAAGEVKVVLTGEGADELMGGYERYYQTIYNLHYGKLVPTPLRKAARALINLMPDTFVGKRKAVRTSLYLDNNVDTLLMDNYAAFTRDTLHTALRPGVVGAPIDSIYANFDSLMDISDADELLDKILYADIKTYLLELLMKQDQMSMSTSIESRVPFLDHHLVEFVCHLPTEYKIKGFETKRIERVALGKTIPDQIVTRPKQGFPTPTREWFRGSYYPLIEKLLLSDDSLSTEYINPDFTRDILDRHRRSRWDLQEQIWTLANFEIWLRVFIDCQQPEEIFGAEEKVRACAYSG